MLQIILIALLIGVPSHAFEQIDNPDYCLLCEFIFDIVDILLEQNATQQEIWDFLDNDVCPFVKQYTESEVNFT